MTLSHDFSNNILRFFWCREVTAFIYICPACLCFCPIVTFLAEVKVVWELALAFLNHPPYHRHCHHLLSLSLKPYS